MKSTNLNSFEKAQNKSIENISLINQSNEQEIINYSQINTSKEKPKSNISSTKDQQQSKIEIEQKNIQMLIFQRSLYIMKQRFSQNRKETQIVYDKYKNSNYKSLECISTENLFDCFKEVFTTNQINLYPYDNFNDLATADLVSGINEEKYNNMINELVLFTKKNVEKYNEKFYENKMKKKKLKEEEEKQRLKDLEENDVSDKVKIVHKNKKGEIVSDFSKITETNKKVVIDELIYTVTEEDMTILTSNKLLYYGVIPLIIADFIQENMEKNINIGIIITNRNFYHENEDLLLEQNIKVLFDKEIIKLYSSLNKIDPKEEKNEDLKKLLFESNSIDNKIKVYNELILENSKKGENITYLMEMIVKLKEQKVLYQKKISEINNKKISLNYNSMNISNSQSHSKTINTNMRVPKKISPIKSQNKESITNINNAEKNKFSKINNKSLHNSKNSSKIILKIKNKKLSKEEIRNNTLKEIFYFYCKQHLFIGKAPTFGDLLTKIELMNLSDFVKFCTDFKILVKKDKIISRIFKQDLKSKQDLKDLKDLKDANLMTFDDFVKCIKKLASLMNEEKIWYKRDKINVYQLQKNELSEKQKKKKKKNNKKKKKIINNKENHEEEEKNLDENKVQIEMTNQENNNIINQKNENNKKQENNNIEDNKSKEKENNIENKEEEKEENKEGKNEENKEGEKEEKISESKKDIKKIEQIDTQNLLLDKQEEDLERKISELQNELSILEQKNENEVLEDFYAYIELDDPAKCQKKMKGFTRPFMVREDDTRNLKQNVKNPIKFNKQSIMRRYEYFIQRKDDIKKQKELQIVKEKKLKYEERKKSFNKQLKKLEKDYDSKIKKDNYMQIKRNEDDYIKGKNNKLTWNFIQNNDYQKFLLNDERNISNNNIPSQLQNIFNNKSDYINNLGDDEDFINKIFSNKIPNEKTSSEKSKISNNENSRYDGIESFSKYSNLSID